MNTTQVQTRFEQLLAIRDGTAAPASAPGSASGFVPGGVPKAGGGRC
jgi:hypothetical protein